MKQNVTALFVCTSLLAGGVAACRGQVTLIRRDFNDLSVSYNSRNGCTVPFSVTASGTITQAWWWIWSTGWRDLHICYTLPDGTLFESVIGQPGVSITQVAIGKESGGRWQLDLFETVPGPAHVVSTRIQLVTQRHARKDLPVTGLPVAELSRLDDIVVEFLTKYGFEAATLAVVRNGRLVFEHGYGWQDEACTRAIEPNAIMRLASNTIPITRAAVRDLIDSGRLAQTARVCDLLGVRPTGVRAFADARVRNITVADLLNDRSGWTDHAPSPRDVGTALGLGHSATLDETITYMYCTSKLLFAPGTSVGFSHWGYQLLGAVIECASGLSYGDYIHSEIGLAGGMPTLQMAGSTAMEALDNETWYAGETFEHPDWDFHQTQPLVPAPYAIDMAAGRGAGSLACSARDYGRFLVRRFHTGQKKPASLSGLTWEYVFYGSLNGTLTVTFDKVTPDGSSLSFVLLVNERISSWADLHNEIKDQVREYLLGVRRWPTIDLFVEPEALPSEPDDPGTPLSSSMGHRIVLPDTHSPRRFDSSSC